MKKTILRILSVLILLVSLNAAYAKVNATSPETAKAIKYYKSGNYVQTRVLCNDILKKDPSNALAQYYYAMSSVQLGFEEDAINAYDNVIQLSPNGVLGSYAKKGKKCLENPSACREPEENLNETWEDKFIKGSYGSGFSKKARGVHEKEKIENLKREINRNKDVPPDKFRGYKDFSSYAPTNDEIVDAIRTLQRAGLAESLLGRNYGSDVYGMLGDNYQNRNDMMNMLYTNRGMSNLNPQIIQSLLSTQMSNNF